MESTQPRRFGYVEEDLLCVIATQLATRIALLRMQEDEVEPAASATGTVPFGPPLVLRRYADSLGLAEPAVPCLNSPAPC